MNRITLLDLIRSRLPDAIQSDLEAFGETTIEIKKESLIPLMKLLKETPEPGFEVLMDLTAVDYLMPVVRTKVVYWLHNPTNYQRLRIVLFAARDETIPSVTEFWRGADWYERELFDLFGIHFEGHPDLKRILMPDDWDGHPLRRDYALTEVPVQFKHGVKPKIPSEIIPHVKNKK